MTDSQNSCSMIKDLFVKPIKLTRFEIFVSITNIRPDRIISTSHCAFNLDQVRS